MLEFIKKYWGLFALILLLIVLIIVLIAFVVAKKKKDKKQAKMEANNAKKRDIEPILKNKKTASEKSQKVEVKTGDFNEKKPVQNEKTDDVKAESKPKQKKVEKTAEKKEEKKTQLEEENKKEEKKTETKKVEHKEVSKKPATNKPAVKKPVEPKEEENGSKEEKPLKKEEKIEEKKEKDINETYRVVYDKEQKNWIVRIDGGQRASRRCATKEEALKVAKDLAKKKDADLSVHKKNGKFQKV